VAVEETAFLIRPCLKHPNFRATAQRRGKIIRIQARHLEYRTKNAERRVQVAWGL
jgi:hypothetical protein